MSDDSYHTAREDERVFSLEGCSAGGKHSSSSSFKSTVLATNFLVNKDNIVLGYPEKAMPAKEPVISLDIEEDEERIMQADWGNESDDDSIMDRQNKRLSTVEREQNEKQDRESKKETWIMHTTSNGRAYYYNSVTRESVWEIPKTSPTTQTTSTTALAAVPTAAISPSSSSTEHKVPSSKVQSTSKQSSDTDKVEIKQTRETISAPTNTNKAKQNSLSGANSSTSTNTLNITSTSTQFRERSNNSTKDNNNKRCRLLDSSSHSRHSRLRYGASNKKSRSRSPLPPPPPFVRDYHYIDYRHYSRSPSPPPYRRYPSYDRYNSYYSSYTDRYVDSDRYSPSPPPPDIYRYRHYDPSPPPPSYYRFKRERSWDHYEPHRSNYYR